MQKKRIFLTKKRIILAVVVLVLIVGAGFVTNKYLFSSNRDTTKSGTNGINYGPPTEEEKKAGDEQKEKIVTDLENQTKQQDQGGSKAAEVIITDAGQYGEVIEARAFIGNVYEDGTCQFVFKKGAETVSKQMPAYKDATTTICTNPVVSRSEFKNNGEWAVSVTFRSTTAQGTSESRTFRIE